MDGLHDAAVLHYELFPYLYGLLQARQPVLRPLGYGYPADPGSWAATYELLVGPDLLASPVTGPGTTPTVYLPPGPVDRPVQRGGGPGRDARSRARRRCAQFPLYARAGAVIPFNLRTASALVVGRRRADPSRPRRLPGDQRRARRPDGAAARRPAVHSQGRTADRRHDRRQARQVELEPWPAARRRRSPPRPGGPRHRRVVAVIEFTDGLASQAGAELRGRQVGSPVPAPPQPARGVRAPGGQRPRARRDRHHRPHRRPLRRDRAPLARSRSQADPLEPALDRGERLAAVPRAAAPARLLAQPPLRPARAPRGGRQGRLVGRARHGARARVRDRHEPALHDVRPLRRRRRSPSRRRSACSAGATSRSPGRRCARSASAAGCCSSAPATRSTTSARRSAFGRSGIDYAFAGHVAPGPAVLAALEGEDLDELIVADDEIAESLLLEIVEAAHRAGVKVLIAPRTTRAPRRARRVRPGPGGAAVPGSAADPRRRRLGVEARLRPRRRRDRDRDRPARLAPGRARDQAHLARPGVLLRRARRARGAPVRDAEVPHDGRRTRQAGRPPSSRRTRRAARSSRSATTRASPASAASCAGSRSTRSRTSGTCSAARCRSSGRARCRSATTAASSPGTAAAPTSSRA